MEPADTPSRDAEGTTPTADAGRPALPTLPREVLVGVRRGDPAALARLFEACFDRVYSLAGRMLGDRNAAQDVAQEVFLNIQRAASRLDPDRDPMPWVVTITCNACRDHLRSRENRTEREGVRTEDTLPARAPDPEEQALAKERERIVQDALIRLPEEMRVVVILRDYMNMRHEDIAGIVGASTAAVRKRYSRALTLLAGFLKGFVHE